MSYGPPNGPRDGRTRAYPVPGPPQDHYQRPYQDQYQRQDQYRQDDRQWQGGYGQQPPGGVGVAEPRRRRRWGFGRILLTILIVIIVLIAAVWIYLETAINRVEALTDYAGRPAAGAGTNWLIVGSDSRAGLNAEDEERLATGDAKGQRTDTVILLHIPDNSEKATMVSLLRDSYVDIPGKGKNKLNAAYAFGGPKLLAQTVEKATNLRLDHYIEIGFGGFAGIVDDVGGVEMCLDKPMKDPKAGIDLPAGCQTLDGANALGYVRTRATPSADLDRVVHQRQFVGALMNKATSFGTIINPFRMVPMIADVPDAITLDEGDHVHNLPALGFAMAGAGSGKTITTTVPFGGTKNVGGSVGSVVLWNDAKAKTLFDALRNDTAVPDSVIVAPSG